MAFKGVEDMRTSSALFLTLAKFCMFIEQSSNVQTLIGEAVRSYVDTAIEHGPNTALTEVRRTELWNLINELILEEPLGQGYAFSFFGVLDSLYKLPPF